jgi:hypothetical protein
VFPLTQPILNFSPDPRNFIDLHQKNSNLLQKYRTFFVFATSAKIWAVLCVCRDSMDTGNKTFVQFNETFKIVLRFAMYSLELEIKF